MRRIVSPVAMIALAIFCSFSPLRAQAQISPRVSPLSALQDAINALQQQVESLFGITQNLEDGQNTLTERTATLEGSTQVLLNQADEVEDLENRASALETSTAALQEKTNNLKDQVDALQGQITNPPPPNPANSNRIFLNLGKDLLGPVGEKGREGWFEISSFQHGLGRAVSSSAGGGSRETSTPSFSEIVVTKSSDVATPKLALEAAAGDKGIAIVKVEFVRPGPDQTLQTYLKYELSDVLISGYSLSGAGGSGSEAPSESLSLNFTKIKWTTTTYDPKTGEPTGEVTTAYDLAQTKPI